MDMAVSCPDRACFTEGDRQYVMHMAGYTQEVGSALKEVRAEEGASLDTVGVKGRC